MKKNLIIVLTLISFCFIGAIYQFTWRFTELEVKSSKPIIQNTLTSASLDIPDSALYYEGLKGYREKMENIFLNNSGSLKEFSVNFIHTGASGKIGAYDEAFLTSLLATPATQITIRSENGFNIHPQEVSLFSRFMRAKDIVFQSDIWLVANTTDECLKALSNADPKLLMKIKDSERKDIQTICRQSPYQIFQKR